MQVSGSYFHSGKFLISHLISVGLLAGLHTFWYYEWIAPEHPGSFIEVILTPYLCYLIGFEWFVAYLPNSLRLDAPRKFTALIVLGIKYVVSFLVLAPLLSFLLQRLFTEEWVTSGYGMYLWSILQANVLFAFLSGIIAFLIVKNHADRYQFLKLERDWLKLKEDLKEVEIQSLSHQINSHFIFNAMNSISVAIRKGEGEKAIDMLSDLADLIREIMRQVQTPFVPLHEELRVLKRYFNLEMIRFKDKVELSMSTSEDSLGVLVPRFLLQPIFENAFKHGVSQKHTMHLTFNSSINAGELILQIYNSHSKVGIESMNPQGIGLSNTVKRLRNLYGGRYVFQMEAMDEGVRFTIKLPLK